MELSHDERRRLRSIEKQLLAEDPDLARRLGEWPDTPWNAAIFAIPLVVIGIVGIVAGLLVASLLIAVISGLVPVSLGIWLNRRRRRPPDKVWLDE
ncbi:DUF3040 domain-containing protein [Pseudonocardia zijingensis]|jgi:Flp pilus assembly protein TadB|uniref:DUF3040 domain-containing protein n=1 Tax=Pseudonocardia zijingensis TaxID=153376 RepID=A0ABP4BHA6_9PSEU